jgi:hypothetical protein
VRYARQGRCEAPKFTPGMNRDGPGGRFRAQWLPGVNPDVS